MYQRDKKEPTVTISLKHMLWERGEDTSFVTVGTKLLALNLRLSLLPVWVPAASETLAHRVVFSPQLFDVTFDAYVTHVTRA